MDRNKPQAANAMNESNTRARIYYEKYVDVVQNLANQSLVPLHSQNLHQECINLASVFQ